MMTCASTSTRVFATPRRDFPGHDTHGTGRQRISVRRRVNGVKITQALGIQRVADTQYYPEGIVPNRKMSA